MGMGGGIGEGVSDHPVEALDGLAELRGAQVAGECWDGDGEGATAHGDEEGELDGAEGTHGVDLAEGGAGGEGG